MTVQPLTYSRRFARVSILLFALLLFALVWTAAAAAETPDGNPVVRLPLGKKGHGLKAPGVKVTTYGKGRLQFGDAGLVISDVAVLRAKKGTLVLKNGIKLRRGKRRVTLKGMMVVVSGRHVRVTGKLGRHRMTLFTGRASKAKIDGGRIAVAVRVKKLKLSHRAKRAIAKKLRRFKPRSSTLGLLSADAYVVAPPIDGSSLIDPGMAAGCHPVSGPSTDPAKPAGAIDISCGQITWHMRDSWISYIGFGAPVAPGAGLPAYPGAQHPCPGPGATKTAVYSFSLPVQSGWWDAATQTGAIFSAGGAHFVETDLGIDITFTNIELRFNGAGSEMWVYDVDKETHPGGARMRFATMNAAAPMAGGPLAPGVPLTRLKTYVDATMESTVFQGHYSAGEAFGCVDAGFNF